MRSACIALFAGVSCIALASPVSAGGAHGAKSYVYSVLYAFSGKKSGFEPEGSLIRDAAGDLYGTTHGGGRGAGTVFEVAPDGTEKVLYAFEGGSDGAAPQTGLMADSSGNLYGTTGSGGGSGCSGFGCGTVFEITPGGKEHVLYAFCSTANCSDGREPRASLILDKAGNLYGTTELGGTSTDCSQGCGTVFEVTPGGTETVLYSFAGPHNGDGASPTAPVLRDKSGNLYGTTATGGVENQCEGAFGCGTVFKLAPDGTETLLYAFKGGSDGDEPAGGLIVDKSGNLVGTTQYGGGKDCSGNGCGTVFTLAPDGTETEFSFDYTDGANPMVGVVADSAGNYYGTTFRGGTHLLGVVFKLAPDGTETVLWNFCSETKCADGGAPFAGVIIGGKGALFGTASLGGTGGYGGRGTVFSLTR